ncbi:putative Ankyrin repeat domain-containing protein 50 [Seiridium cardinale]
MKAIATELSGIPLALEQAGALIRNGESTCAQFLVDYKKEYRYLMSTYPDKGMCSYEKSLIILTVLDMACSKIDLQNAALLTFIGVLGTWQIPISLIEEFPLMDSTSDEHNPILDDMNSLHNILHNPRFLRLSLRRLASLHLIRLEEDGGQIAAFTLHRILRQWSLEKVISHSKQDYFIQAAYGLAKKMSTLECQPDIPKKSYLPDQVVELKYLAPFKNCLALVKEHVPLSHLDPDTGRMRSPYDFILHQAAWASLAEGNTKKAKDYFQAAITFETIKLSQAGADWPVGQTALTLLCGLSRATHKSDDLTMAIEALQSALPLSQKLHGDTSDITLAIVSRLKRISEKQEISQQHHEAAVVALSSTARDASFTKAAPVIEPLEPQEGAPRYSLDKDLSYCGLDKTKGETEDEFEDPNITLFGAVYHGDESWVRLIIGLPTVDLDREDNFGRTALYMAAWQGHKKTVELLLETGRATLSVRDYRGRSPLLAAACEGHEAVVRLLLEKNAEIESKDNEDRTPLSWAAREGHEVIVRLLLEKKAEIESKDNDNRTPLLWAALRGHEVIVRLLLEKNAAVESKDNNGQTPLSWAARKGYDVIIRLLLEEKAAIESKDIDKRAPLLWAAREGHETTVRLLLDEGADWMTADNYGGTPLFNASMGGQFKVVKLLLEKDPSPSFTNPRGWTALHVAADKGHAEVVTMLSESSCLDISQQDNNGRTALFIASMRGQLDVVQILLSKSPLDVFTKDHYNATPLFVASRHGHEQVANVLLSIDVTSLGSTDIFGRTILWWARKSGNPLMVDLFNRNISPASTIDVADDESVGSRAKTRSVTFAWCGVCTMDIASDYDCHCCAICDGGQFCICLACFDFGVQCQDAGHEWSLVREQRQTP